MEKVNLKEVNLNSNSSKLVRPNTGLDPDGMKNVAALLSKTLANSYALMLKSQNYHWNVRGIHFKTIHEMTEEHYTDLFHAVDVIAERIRALGVLAPGSFPEFNNLTNITDPKSELSEMEMVADLLKSHEHLITNMRNVLEEAEKIGDEVTVDMMVERLEAHEKNSWMLRSMIES